MKQSLTLEDIACYLPYGLRAQVSYHGVYHDVEVYTCGYMSGDKETIWLTISGGGDVVIGEQEFKLYLRPLSQLTEEIEHNGERLNLFSKFSFYSSTEYLIEQIRIGLAEYTVVNKCFKYHFDVFGLIDSGLAIEIPSLKQEEKV